MWGRASLCRIHHTSQHPPTLSTGYACPGPAAATPPLPAPPATPAGTQASRATSPPPSAGSSGHAACVHGWHPHVPQGVASNDTRHKLASTGVQTWCIRKHGEAARSTQWQGPVSASAHLGASSRCPSSAAHVGGGQHNLHSAQLLRGGGRRVDQAAHPPAAQLQVWDGREEAAANGSSVNLRCHVM
jgi:hypothetical protein